MSAAKFRSEAEFELSVAKQILRISFEGTGYTPKHADGRITSTSLDPPQVGHINLGVMGELLLGEPPLAPQPPYIPADDLVPVHRTGWSRVVGKPLGTIVPVFD